MPINFKKFFEGIKIIPKASSTANAKGELEVDSASGKLQYHNGTTVSPVVTESHTATFTNKTFDADGAGNSISNIENADIKSGANIAHNKMAALTANRAMVTDGSGVASASSVTATELGNLSGTTSNLQTQLNAKLDDFASSNDNRVVRTNGTAGDAVQESPVTLDDSGNMSGVGTLGLTGPVTDQSLTANRALASNGSKAIVSTSVTDTELSYVSGVTSSIQTQINAKVSKSGDTMSGALSMGGNQITSLAAPSNATDAANKAYVDSIAEGLHVHAPAKAATTGTLASITGGSVTYNNGVSGVGATLTLGVALTTLDGYSLQNGDRILVKNEATQANNGIYTWATGGTVLTRATDFDTTTEIAGGDFVFVQEGTLYGNTGWVETETTSTIGTDAIIFVQFSGAGAITTDGEGIEISGTQLSLELDSTGYATLSKSASGLRVANTSLKNAQIASDAAIARSKLGTGTASHVVINDGSGNFSSEAQLALVRGGAAIDNSQTNDASTTGSGAQLNAVTGHVRVTNGSLVSLAMIPAAASGGIKFSLYNDTGNAITILNESGATAANRIITGQGSDITMGIGMSLDFVYDSAESRWLVIGGTGASTGSGSGFIKVRALDASNTTLPTGAVVIDGLTILDGERVLFTALSSNNNRIYEANESGGNVTSWTTLSLYEGASSDPVDGDTVFIQEGDLYADNILLYSTENLSFVNLLNQKTSLTLTDNTTDEIFLEMDTADFKFMIMEYSIERGTSLRTGIFSAASNGTTNDDNDLPIAVIGDVGVTIDSVMDGTTLQIKYTTTNTGSNATLKRTLRIW